nr:hypothetical protein [Tanacetum cinerariifolium]
MRKLVEEFIGKCLVCQEAKYSTQTSGSLLQPLPTPSRVWEDFSMDFSTGLPTSKGFSVIFVVVDRFTKYAYFGPLAASFNVHKVVDVFIDMVVKHHGIPKTIVSDRDPIFVSKFWKQLFEASGTKLNHNKAYHPQTNEQTEVVNQGLEQYLRVMYEKDALPSGLWACAAYNYSLSTRIIQGRGYRRGMIERDALLRQLKQNLLVTKHRMEMQANRKRQDVECNTEDMVLERVCKVAYRLALLDSSKIHLKGILARPVLVQWSGSSPEEVTWKWLSEFKIAYPSYHLEDKVIFEGEGNDTPEPEPNEKPRPKRVTSKPVWHKDYVVQ